MGTPCRSQMRMVRWVRPGRAGEPQQPAVGIGDNLHVHAVASVFVGVVGPAVADPVALGESPVEEDEVRIMLAWRLQQARCTVGEQVDDRAGVGVGGGLADPESGSGLRQGGVFAQVHQCHHRALRRAELAAPVALTGDDQHGDPLGERMRQVECGRMDDQRGPRAT
ncbi:hypothetical protein GCM10010266_68150 [Streptomyces griseomycini]|nr:hypothetical protein GCM10010266_68150 [Streptomyces griseomycini]